MSISLVTEQLHSEVGTEVEQTAEQGTTILRPEVASLSARVPHEIDFPPVAALATVWQERLAGELIVVVRDSLKRITPRHRRRSIERLLADFG